MKYRGDSFPQWHVVGVTPPHPVISEARSEKPYNFCRVAGTAVFQESNDTELKPS